MLISLAFLNVPRVWFHDCDDHSKRMDCHDESDVHFENDGCYVCDIDLGTYHFAIPSFQPLAKQQAIRINDSVLITVSNPTLFLKPLRGPPVV